MRPFVPSVMFSVGILIHHLGRFDEAIALTEKAMRLYPYYPAMHLALQDASYVVAGRYQ
jgi:hypothetical protein